MADKSTQTHQVIAWFQSSLGQHLLAMEARALSSWWQKILGDYLLILGDSLLKKLAEKSKVKHSIIVSPDENDAHNICAEYEALPIMPDGLQAVLLAHILEFSQDPYQVLREVAITLAPEGYLILMGFNPWSLLSLRRFFSLKKQGVWSGKFRSAWRIKEGLRLLGFEILDQKNIFYLPPVNNKKIWSCFKFCEWIGRTCFSFFGGVYIIVAKKKLFGAVTKKARWQKLSNVVHNGLIKPATRGMQREQNH